MDEVQQRRSMAAGVVFVVLFVAGTLVSEGNAPTIGSNDSAAVAAGKYVAVLSSSGHRVGLLIGGYLLILAALAFIWFTAGLRARLAPTLGHLVSGLGVLGAAAITTAAMTSAAIAGGVSFGGEPVPRDGETVRAVMDLTFPLLFVVFGLVSAALIAAVAISAKRADLPSWVLYSGWVAVIGCVFAVVFIPMVLPLLWYLAVAITGLTRPKRSSAPAQSAAGGRPPQHAAPSADVPRAVGT